MRKEHKISITLALSVMRRSKKSLSDLKDSVGPVSPAQQALKKLEVFLEEFEKEVRRLPKRKILFFSCVLLAPVKEFLLELWVKAIAVITNLLG